MGGIGYITRKHAEVALNLSPSACIYPQFLQRQLTLSLSMKMTPSLRILRKVTAREVLRGEVVPIRHRELEATRVARFHNVYGPLGTYDGRREKAPAAIRRKVTLARDGAEIEIWGDGQRARSLMCVGEIYRVTRSNYSAPLKLGTDELVTVDDTPRSAMAGGVP
jgi:GDP-D-mannose 3', 5'-epimerase